MADLARIVSAAEFSSAFNVSRETLARLEIYVALLEQWQKSQNLVAPATLPLVWSRHVADSAQLVGLAPPAPKSWLDLGSGAGFPGLVIAILLAESHRTRVQLVESNSGKCAFLREVARQTGLSARADDRGLAGRTTVEIINARIEGIANTGTVRQVDVVSARALAPLGKLLGYAAPFFAPDTVGLFPKGRETQSEVDAARQDWAFSARQYPSGTDPDGQIVEIRQLLSLKRGLSQ